MELVLSCDADDDPITNTDDFAIVINQDAQYTVDDIRMVSDDLATTTTYAYDDANELTSMTVDSSTSGSTTTFSYDAWGRTVTKARSADSRQATYDYRFGHKLKQITSNFPDEAATVSYMYDGLEKRRIKAVDDDDWVWWRWDAGWHMVAQYMETG